MKKSFEGSSVGTSLILVIFILLCLLTFGTLSMISANADNKLSISSAENVVEFYLADAKAQTKIKDIDKILQVLYDESENEQEYYENVYKHFKNDTEVVVSQGEELDLNFITTVSTKEILSSQLRVIYPNNAQKSCYKIQSWKLVNTKVWEESSDQNIWDGQGVPKK